MKTFCPHCLKQSTVPDVYKGKGVRCLNCNETFTVREVKPQPSIVPFDKLKKAPKESVKASRSFLQKAWFKSPPAFRSAFLATFGVISALWVAWSVLGIQRHFSSPPVKHTVQTQNPRPNTKSVNIEYYDFLAGSIRLNRYLSKLHSLQNVRVAAASRYGKNNQILYFIGVLLCTQDELESLYNDTHNMNLPKNKSLENVYNKALVAIDAEYAFQKSLIAFCNNPDSLKKLTDMSEKSKEAVQLADIAVFSGTALFIEFNEELLHALVRLNNTE